MGARINKSCVSFHPAGHILGSAQIRLEYKGYIVVFSGDYKTQPDFITTPFEPVKCHEFITESTFGLPIYKWKSEEELQKELQDWIVQNQQNNRTSVFLGYSLGKAHYLHLRFHRYCYRRQQTSPPRLRLQSHHQSLHRNQ